MITNQAYLFLIFTIDGLIIGLLFDFFRILRRTFKTKDIITYIQDILFWILTGAIILYSTFTFNNGEIRLFMFIGILIGTIIYMLFISSHIVKVSVIILNFFKNTIYKILKIIFMPFQKIFKSIRKLFTKPITFVIVNIRNFSTKLFKNSNINIKKLQKSKNIVKN